MRQKGDDLVCIQPKLGANFQAFCLQSAEHSAPQQVQARPEAHHEQGSGIGFGASSGEEGSKPGRWSTLKQLMWQLLSERPSVTIQHSTAHFVSSGPSIPREERKHPLAVGPVPVHDDVLVAEGVLADHGQADLAVMAAEMLHSSFLQTQLASAWQ